MRAISRLAGATAYAAAACLFFFILQFPAGDFSGWLTGRVNAGGAFVASIKNASAGLFPPGVRLEEISLSSAGGAQILKAPQAFASLSLSSLAAGRPGFVLTIPAYGGELRLTLAAAPLFGGGQARLTLDIEDVDPAKLPAGLLPSGAGLQGLLSGEASFAFEASGPPGASGSANPPNAPAAPVPPVTGKGELRLAGASLAVPAALFAVERLDLGEVKAAFTVKGQEAAVSELVFKSPRASGKLSGTLRAAPDIPNSALALAGEWKVDPADLKMTAIADQAAIKALRQRAPLSLRLSGTLAAPQCAWH